VEREREPLCLRGHRVGDLAHAVTDVGHHHAAVGGVEVALAGAVVDVCALAAPDQRQFAPRLGAEQRINHDAGPRGGEGEAPAVPRCSLAMRRRRSRRYG
jgi:hypothetical protein